MKIILVAVISINGKTTKGRDPDVHDWSSKEDQEYFAALKEKSRLIIMGRKTYEAAKGHTALSPKILRVVLTKNPKRYRHLTVQNQLEFTNQPPKKLLATLKRRGYAEALLVGGSEVNSAFLRANLIDEIWLTVEPLVLGTGKTLFSKDRPNKRMRLLHSKQLNKSGTLLLKYTVER